jgi:hypothetical protein
MRDKILKGVMAGVCAYDLAAQVAETARFGRRRT